ncbi:MAG: ribose-phosphate pyrophosphokinase [Alphaproteobacteria bacterium]|nr:ribose-phosphate pyrophosphokinase [Alphaproteobacteria bacterium]MDE2011652.1 ribose-phosphate pyrophosphokinase [Alphaproteobacteria bacterium]MDE2075326.1 ribose-phosphate pyrophosphokinase [Alphaproteobacteria bacterium]
MSAVLFALPGNETMAVKLAAELGAEVGTLELRRFPDEELHLRFATSVAGKCAIFVCTLDRPDGKFLPLAFAAATARELGAAEVGLVAPYLAYMRQDRHFEPGDAETAPIFAACLSRTADWLVTVDPHLHRLKNLSLIYSIPTRAQHAAAPISRWIADNVPDAVLIGPDAESAQWVGAVAKTAGKPFVVLTKTRRGDRDVSVTVPEVERWRAATPVLVDDIISTGRTMAETLGHLAREKMKPAVCIGVHAVFAPGAYDDLRRYEPARIVTTDTIAHQTNAIDVAGLLAEGVRALWRAT